MTPFPLLPFYHKLLGLAFVVIGVIAGIASLYFGLSPEWLAVKTHAELPYMNTQNLIDEVALTLILIGLMAVAFSRERAEDEFVNHIRLHSLLWSVIIYFTIVLVSVWVFYDDAFWSVMIYHLFMPLVFYIVLFRLNYWMKMKS